MFGKGIKLFTLFGFAVRVDWSWIIIAVLVTWSLAAGLFATWYPELPTATLWTMGVAGALGLFASIVLHELSHSLAAREFGIPMTGITLFVFGGVAHMDEEPPTAKSEFVMAIAGPIASVVIGAVCYGMFLAGTFLNWPVAVNGVIGWLSAINIILVVFNMVPAFPLDGGRVLRSLLWAWKGNIRWATRITSRLGSSFGIFLMIMGVLAFVGGQPVGGMWWLLIGLFLYNAARMSYQQLLTRQALEGEPVSRFMKSDPVTVSANLSVEDLVENYVYEHHFKMFPVTENGELKGCITTRDVRNLPRAEWSARTVGEVAQPCSDENTIEVDADAMSALKKMSQSNVSRLMVVKEGRLAGIISLKDLMRFLSLKIELEDDDDGGGPNLTPPAPRKRDLEKVGS